MAGAGKSTAIHVLEDLGFYCIDNLPVVLLPRFLELCETATEGIGRVALGIDLREREFLHGYPAVLDDLRRQGRRVEVLFLDASDAVLVQRFGETRRPHPLAGDAGPLAGIAREREQIAGLRERADRIVDTSALTIHQLRAELTRGYAAGQIEGTLRLLLTSFGFKFGLPADAEMVFDTRFVTNPYFVDELRDRDGLDAAVAQFVLDRDETRQLLAGITGLLELVFPLYQRDGKSSLAVAVGCTGGRHRSVVIVERLAQLLAAKGLATQVRHRDLGR
ncbi:MAG: RNase adapter RapZ [Deltaproteobacteria bacterium]|nr:RNase adapter RapZ [Deltaproteobacteria bacterium]